MSKKAKRLIITAIAEWERLRYFHRLVEFICDEDNSDHLVLYSECYQRLTSGHREKLEATLYALKDCLDRVSD